jgi:hypothetical protein
MIRAQENDLRSWTTLVDQSGRFQPVHLRQHQIQQNQIWLQLFAQPDRIQSIDAFANNLQACVYRKNLTNSTSPLLKIVNNQNTYWSQLPEVSPGSREIVAQASDSPKLIIYKDELCISFHRCASATFPAKVVGPLNGNVQPVL